MVLTVQYWAQDEEACDEERITFNEPFDSTTYRDQDNTSAKWIGNGVVTLSNLGANFRVAEPNGMGARIYVCDAGDFDGDGMPDLMGLDITDGINRLILVRNHFEDLDGDGEDDDGTVFYIDENEVYEEGLNCGPASITVADYNDDGLLDFFFYKNANDAFSYTNFVAAMYINVGTETDPDFYAHYSSPTLDFSSRFQSAGIYANWAGDHLASYDIDNDGDIDVLVISEDKIFLIRNPGHVDNVDAFEIAELNYDLRTGFNTGRGGSSVDAGDFDNDGDLDIIGGSVMDIPYLVYYENDGAENFTRKTIDLPVPEVTGTVATCVADFNNDGYTDIFGGNDRWNAGNEARMWLQKNLGLEDLTFQFLCLNNCDPILPDPHDIDMSAVLDYDQDGDYDVVLADANHSGDYYLIINELAPVYALYGEAHSINLSDELDPETQAITRVRFLNLDQTVWGPSEEGLAIEYWVSNNNGRNWEFYVRFGADGVLASSGTLQNYTTTSGLLPWHSFTHFGSQLKWKAILTATEDEMDEYEGASFETPVLDRIRLRYAVVERREYSRTSVAANVVTDEGDNIKLIVGGTFYFPGWQGHLRAYDVSNMALLQNAYSELRTITRPDLGSPDGRELVASGVEIRWDAGELLMSRSPASRDIYAVLADNSLIPFTIANEGVLGPIISDFENDNEGLIEFVRGEGRYWRLGDINHSNPVVLSAPNPDDAPYMGPGYDTFASDWQDREKVMFVGANDGMIHCFSVLTGEELWAIIPYNLLSKVRNMRGVDPVTKDRFFSRDVYVDGSPVVADVMIAGNWRTVLICGQGAGKGLVMGDDRPTGNYYFALDVTDVEDPQSLWEFTDYRMGETWSVPEIGRIRKDGDVVFAAFMGSGYDNVSGMGRQGHRFFAVDIAMGESFWYFDANPEINTATGDPDGVIWSNNSNIAKSIPASPGVIDIDADGYLDRVYVGDLEGRMWKIDVGVEYLSGDPWEAEVIYMDSNNYPIITKPAIFKDPQNINAFPRLYFGTGGDDRAPADDIYSFVALMDDPDADNQSDRIEWYLGDPALLDLPEEKAAGLLGVGEKVWADPKIASNIIYFSTLTGNIETVDPCESISGIGRLYARYLKAVGGAGVGGTAFRGASGNMENLDLEIKTRAAVTLGERERVSGVYKREVYIQEFDSTIQKLEQPTGALLKIRSWREIYQIKK